MGRHLRVSGGEDFRKSPNIHGDQQRDSNRRQNGVVVFCAMPRRKICVMCCNRCHATLQAGSHLSIGSYKFHVVRRRSAAVLMSVPGHGFGLNLGRDKDPVRAPATALLRRVRHAPILHGFLRRLGQSLARGRMAKQLVLI